MRTDRNRNLIADIFLIRGVSFGGLMPMFPENRLTFWLVSSAVCIAIGMLYSIGTYQPRSEISGH